MDAPTTHRGLTRRRLLGGAAALLAAAGGGTAWALDRFVVEHAELTNASASWTSGQAATGAADSDTGTVSGAVTGTSWTGPGGTITISAHSSGSDARALAWFVADLQLTSATALRAAFADDTYGENVIERPSAIAAANDAVWALNGDYYGFRDDGIVIRNGVAFRDRGARQGLAFGRSGALWLYDETATRASTLVDEGVWHTLSFGPGLVEGGRVVAGIDQVEIDTNVGNHSVQGAQPRTAIGMIAPNHLVAVVADGRSTGYSRGVGMSEFAGLFVDLGAEVAYNLDGGGSSTMVFDGSLVNNPLGRGAERGTSDILFLAG